MNQVLHRIHIGVMGDAFCRATYGWFCEIESTPSEIFRDLFDKDLFITRRMLIDIKG